MSDELSFNEESPRNERDNRDNRDTRGSRDERDDRDDDRRSNRNSRDRDDRDDRNEDQPRKAWNMGNLARMNGRPTLGGISDAALNAMIEAFNNAKSFDSPGIHADIQRSRFKVIPFTGSAAGSALPSLLVCLPLTLAAGSVILTYTLVIEQPGPVATRNLSDRGDNFDALFLPEDRLTERYQKAIKEEVAGLAKNAKVILIGSQVILASTIAQVTEKEKGHLISAIYDNAIDAICGYRQNILDKLAGNRGGEYRLNPDAIERGDRLETSFDFSGKQGLDSSGLPIRTDALVSLYYSAQSPDEDNIYNRIPMAEARVGLDLMIADSGERESVRLGRRRSRNRDRDEEEAPLQPLLNINAISSVDDYPYSLELVQLMFANTALLSNDFRWTNILRPRSHIAGNLKTISKLSDLIQLTDLDPEVKAEAAERVSPNMNDDDFADFIDVCVRPKVAFGMVVPSSGEKSWVLSIFERIATGKKRSEVDDLVTILFDSADVLTDNRFRPTYKKLCDGSMPVPVKTAGTRALIGTWIDPDTSTVRDAREWNVQAVLSKTGAKSLDLVKDYQWTLEDDRRSVEFNMADRYAILNKIVPGLHIVGSAEQLVFLPEYFQALAIALDDARMSSIVSAGDTLSGRRNVGRSFFSDSSSSDLGASRRRGSDRDRRGGGRSLFGDDGDRYY